MALHLVWHSLTFESELTCSSIVPAATLWVRGMHVLGSPLLITGMSSAGQPKLGILIIVKQLYAMNTTTNRLNGKSMIVTTYAN